MGVHVLHICLAGLALYIVGRLVWRKKTPLPPGPPGWPLIGNLLDFGMHIPYKRWGALSRKYGPIVSFNLIGKRFVVLNSPKVAKALLEKKSAITSNRPHLTMSFDLVGWGNHTPFLQYGDTYRKHRKFFHQQIGTKSSLEPFYHAEEAEAKKFLRSLLKDPDGLIAHCHRTVSSVILKVSHGYSVQEDSDPLMEMGNNAMHNLSLILAPGRFLVDVLPILRHLPEWFPGGGFRKYARQWRKQLSDATNAPYDFVVEHLAKGDAVPSFVSQVLQEGITPEEEEILKRASFFMYLGGAESTPSLLIAFFLAMTMYPEVLKKAQAEVDAVVGRERLPTPGDRDALPYVNAICTELLRWHAAVPWTIYANTQDIIYEGYLIPKGTYLLGNIWCMLSDPETYPNPDVFDPERFLGEDQQLDPREVCFGWGRRSCPGMHLAELTIFTCVAMALATLDVSRRVENGVECVPRYEIVEGLFRQLKPFKCSIVPRSEKVEDLLSV